jgi:crotonobetainyl-CoA:carnitine CoA-transferase CaiB-like acyl-CoA transferase
VIELGTTIAGPFCARLMADFGAEVIKIEPATGDPVRASSKRIHTKSLYAASLMRNNRSSRSI